MWKWLERKIFRRLELRLSAEIAGRLEELERKVERTIITAGRGAVDSVAELVSALDKENSVVTSHEHAQILAWAKMAANVEAATRATELAAKVEQLSLVVGQAISLQFGKTPNTIAMPPSRAPRDFDEVHRQ